ncbi:MAG TPA: hypothetical protein PLP21_12350 [Pyrinomonadaceae bacterium]|nr:hypothetical protein [Pyrinomonadaceae bacterium]
MRTEELIQKGFIDISDDVNFRTHADVLRLFGKDVKIFQKAFAKHPHEDSVHIWFPMFYDDDNNDWENTFGLNEDAVFERRKHDNEGYLTEQFDAPQNHRRILFAKIAPFGRVFYKFKGIYQFDPELSRKAKKAAYRRVAKQAKLYPAG